MGWNEPPGKGRDPWGNRGNGEGPPDLEEMLKRMQQGLGGMFGRKPTGVGGAPGSPLIWLLVAVIVLILLLADMTYLIDEQERGVVLRFGRFARTIEPGLNIQYPSFIDQVVRVNVGQVRSISHKSTMLTQDENIVDVEVAVQWQITGPQDYVFNVYDPAVTLRQVAESAVRQVVGKNKLDFVLTEGRAEIGARQQELMQGILDHYRAGITVRGVELLSVKPPEPVKSAFDDAIKAREDEQRQVNEAEAYRNEVIPRARGAAARMREEAGAYKATVIARAEGDAARFDQLLAEYERAPAVTRERLYLEAMEDVLSGTGKVLLDAEKGSNNVIYLPLDRLLEEQSRPRTSVTTREYPPQGSSQGVMTETDPREEARLRRSR